MCIPLLVLCSLVIDTVRSVTGFYTYQVAQVGEDLELYCLSAGQDIKWSRTINKKKQLLEPPQFQISKSYRCGNPHFCGGYDVEDTKVCVRSTLTLRRLQKSDSGTYFCQEGLHKGSYSFAYIVNILDQVSPPHIYDFEPLKCNDTLWYGCIASKTTSRYEYFVSDSKDKIILHGERNYTVVGDRAVNFMIKNNYISLDDFSILQDPLINIGCRAFDESGGFSEYQTVIGKTVDSLTEEPNRGSYESFLIKMIGIGVGVLIAIILLVIVLIKFRNGCNERRRQSDSNVDYAGINSQNEHKL